MFLPVSLGNSSCGVFSSSAFVYVPFLPFCSIYAQFCVGFSLIYFLEGTSSLWKGSPERGTALDRLQLPFQFDVLDSFSVVPVPWEHSSAVSVTPAKPLRRLSLHLSALNQGFWIKFSGLQYLLWDVPHKAKLSYPQDTLRKFAWLLSFLCVLI